METKKNSMAKGRNIYLGTKDQYITNHISNKKMQVGMEQAQQEGENVKEMKTIGVDSGFWSYYS